MKIGQFISPFVVVMFGCTYQPVELTIPDGGPNPADWDGQVDGTEPGDKDLGDPGMGDPGSSDADGAGDPGLGDPGLGDPGVGDPDGAGDAGDPGDPRYGDPSYGDPSISCTVDLVLPDGAIEFAENLLLFAPSNGTGAQPTIKLNALGCTATWMPADALMCNFADVPGCVSLDPDASSGTGLSFLFSQLVVARTVVLDYQVSQNDGDVISYSVTVTLLPTSAVRSLFADPNATNAGQGTSDSPTTFIDALVRTSSMLEEDGTASAGVYSRIGSMTLEDASLSITGGTIVVGGMGDDWSVSYCACSTTTGSDGACPSMASCAANRLALIPRDGFSMSLVNVALFPDSPPTTLQGLWLESSNADSVGVLAQVVSTGSGGTPTLDITQSDFYTEQKTASALYVAGSLPIRLRVLETGINIQGSGGSENAISLQGPLADGSAIQNNCVLRSGVASGVLLYKQQDTGNLRVDQSTMCTHTLDADTAVLDLISTAGEEIVLTGNRLIAIGPSVVGLRVNGPAKVTLEGNQIHTSLSGEGGTAKAIHLVSAGRLDASRNLICGDGKGTAFTGFDVEGDPAMAGNGVSLAINRINPDTCPREPPMVNNAIGIRVYNLAMDATDNLICAGSGGSSTGILQYNAGGAMTGNIINGSPCASLPLVATNQVGIGIEINGGEVHQILRNWIDGGLAGGGHSYAISLIGNASGNMQIIASNLLAADTALINDAAEYPVNLTLNTGFVYDSATEADATRLFGLIGMNLQTGDAITDNIFVYPHAVLSTINPLPVSAAVLYNTFIAKGTNVTPDQGGNTVLLESNLGLIFCAPDNRQMLDPHLQSTAILFEERLTGLHETPRQPDISNMPRTTTNEYRGAVMGPYAECGVYGRPDPWAIDPTVP